MHTDKYGNTYLRIGHPDTQKPHVRKFIKAFNCKQMRKGKDYILIPQIVLTECVSVQEFIRESINLPQYAMWKSRQTKKAWSVEMHSERRKNESE